MSMEPAAQELSAFIRQERAEIMGEWERRARGLSPGGQLSSTALRDHFPELIEWLAEQMETAGEPGGATPSEPPQHAWSRLYEGYDLTDVVREYSLLRQIIFDAAMEACVGGARELGLLSRLLDEATEIAVDYFAKASQRVLRAVDRISTEAVGRQGVDALLVRLLEVIMQASPAIDEATILLCEGGRLVVRASVGLLARREKGFSLAIGEGFSGSIAANGQARELRDAANDPLISSVALREAGLHALFGVPLIDGSVIGVAHIGSRTAYEFSDEDKLLFRAMANRASSFIVEERLRDAERRAQAELEAVLESIPAGVYFGDSGGLWRVNRRGLALMGVETFEELQRPIDELMRRTAQRDANTGEPLEAADLAFSHALRGETAEAEVALTLLHGGGDIVVHSAAAPVRIDGEILGAVAVNTDITARKRVEAELRDEAQYRERFVGILGHDLRTPVAAITMAASLLLRQEALPERMGRMVRRILASAERIDRMIHDLLDFTRARTGGIPLQLERVDLVETTRAVLDELVLAHAERHILLEADGDGRGTWDPARVSQLVTNLVANALTYSPSSASVRVVVEGDDDRVILRVSNEGAPIPEEIRPYLFDPFRRGVSSSGPAEAGLGLGLFIVRSIVEAHGGSITFDSTAELTTFTVVLPRVARPPESSISKV